MISNDLLDKFDRIEDLPVSEEMLGAYMEGTLNSFEVSQIENLLSENSQLSDFVDEISKDKINADLDKLDNQLFDPSYPFPISDIKLPEETLTHSILVDPMVAACCQENPLNELNISSTDDSLSDDDYLKENLSPDDSFTEDVQSLDIESPESDDTYNDESIEI